MKKLVMFLVITLILLPNFAYSKISKDDLSLAGITLNVSLDTVKNIYGSPLKSELNPNGEPPIDSHDYDGFRIWTINDARSKNRVIYIALTNEKYTTNRNVRVGNNAEILNNTYGKATNVKDLKGKTYYIYKISSDDRERLVFEVDSTSKITKIYVTEAPIGP